MPQCCPKLRFIHRAKPTHIKVAYSKEATLLPKQPLTEKYIFLSPMYK